MQAWVRIFGGAAAIALGAGCTPSTPSTPSPSHTSSDGGHSQSTSPGNASASRCPAPSTECGQGCCPGGTECVSGKCFAPCLNGSTRCEDRCCPEGTQCVSGECHYPYSTARLYVWLCPSFNQGCSANFFQLDQMCSPIGADGVAGTCYDTGLEVSASKTYAMTTCQACGSNCGTPASFNTPPGFLGADWYSGFAYWCNEKCSAPPSCGGSSGGNGSGSSSGTGTSGGTSGGGTSHSGGSADGGFSTAADGGTDAATSGGGPGVCATSASGKCVTCSGPGDPACGAETCCGFDNLSFCTDITVAACIMCMTDNDCDPGVPCCH